MEKKFRIIICTLLSVFLLCACGSGITQEEYDKVVAERDEALEELHNIQNNELQNIADKYKTTINSDYEWCSALYTLLSAISNEKFDTSSLDELYTKSISTIDGIVNMQTKVNEITK